MNLKVVKIVLSWFLLMGLCFPLSFTAENISRLNKQTTQKPCVLASPPWIIKPFLDSKLYSCYGLYQDIESGFSRPFWAVQNVRNLKKGRSYKCDTMYESKFNLLFTNEDIITGRLIKCI